MMFSKSMLDKFATKLEHFKVQNNKIINHNQNAVMTHTSNYGKMDLQRFPLIDNIHQTQLKVIQNMVHGFKQINVQSQQQYDRISNGHTNTNKYIDNSLILNKNNNYPNKQFKNSTNHNNNNIFQKAKHNNNKKQAIFIQLDSDSNIKQQYNDKLQSIIQQPSNLHPNITKNNKSTSKQQTKLPLNNNNNTINNSNQQKNQQPTVQNSIQYKDMMIKRQYYGIILDFLKNNDFGFIQNQNIKGNQQIKQFRQVRQDLMFGEKGQVRQAINERYLRQKKQVIIKQQKNKNVVNSLIKLSQIQQQIQHYQPTQPIQHISPIKPKKIQQRSTPQQIPTSVLNNLLQLYPILPAQIIKLYISQLSKKTNISFINILVSFGIEQTINKFYQTHQVDNPLTQQYILSEIQILLPYFLCKLAISDWRVIQRIAIGLCRRYKVYNKYTDQWLLNIIRKKINALKASGVNIQQIIAMAKIQPIEILYNRMGQFNSDQPTSQMYNLYRYTSLTQYLSTQPQNITSILKLQPLSFSSIQLSQKQGIRTNLSYYTKLLQNKKLRTKQLSSNSDKNQNNKNEQKIQQAEPQNQQQLKFEIQLIKSRFPQNAIALDHIREMEYYYTFQSEIKDNKVIKRLGKNRNKVTNNKVYRPMSQYVNKSQIIKNKKMEKQRNLQQQKQQLKKQARTVKKTSIHITNNQQKTVVQTKNYHVRKTISTQPSIPILPTKLQTKPNDPPIAHISSPLKQTKQVAVNQQKVLQRMDKMIYSYHEQYPNFTMNDLLSYIDKILKNQLQVPAGLHKKIIQAWFNKYKKG